MKSFTGEVCFQVNDLTIDTVRQEYADLESCGKLPIMQICPAR
jgi:hypothetical protein